MSLKNLAVWNAKAVKLVIKTKCRIEKSCHALIVPWNAVTTRTKVKMLCHVKFMTVSRPILKEKNCVWGPVWSEILPNNILLPTEYFSNPTEAGVNLEQCVIANPRLSTLPMPGVKLSFQYDRYITQLTLLVESQKSTK